MSPDWPWPAIVVLAVPPALGHLYVFILAINVGSGLGYSEPVLDRFRSTLFAGLFVSSALLFWAHLRDPWWNWWWPAWSYAVLCVVAGVLVWPLNSLALALRRRPEGLRQRSSMVELTDSQGRESLIGSGPHSWLLRLPGNDAFRLCLREWDVTISDLPEPLAGLEIVQLSDFHLAPCFQRRYFDQVIDACLGWQPDLIVFTGDVVDDEAAIPWIEPLLGRLDARLGKFAILGNHDNKHGPEAIIRELGRAGFETLEGRWTRLEVEGATLAMGGTAAPWGPALDPQLMPPADFRVVLSHTPDLFYQAARWGVDLLLSGHNHGGQIRLPLVGAVFMPSLYSRRFDRGFFQCGKTRLYVNEGIAGLHPMRYGCPPEVTRFVLRSERAATQHLRSERELATIEREWGQG
jgi:predicted MPP superfamily phosphohydrolase